MDFKSNNTLEDIALGTKEILTQLKAKMPSIKIILLGVLPRGDSKGIRAKNVNKLYEKLADNKTVYWLDMWSSFTSSDGKQKSELFTSDTVHPIEAGYKVWQQTMEPLLKELGH